MKRRDRPTANLFHYLAHSQDPYFVATVANFLKGKKFTSFNFALSVEPDGRVYGAANKRLDSFADGFHVNPVNKQLVPYVEA
jgi:hypothetical protein